MSSWSSLPSENCQEIFSYLTFFDITNALLVCRSWFTEADYFLKDKIVFHIDKIPSPEFVMESKRRFENIRINEVNESAKQILSTLKERKIAYADKISEAFVKYQNYEELHSILELIGKDLKTLLLKNKAKETSKLSFPTLSSVETLKVEGFNQSLETISPYLSKLKVLEIRADLKRVSLSLIKGFIEGNPNLEELYYNELWIELGEDPLFKDSKLKVIKTDNSELAALAFKSQLPVERFETNCQTFTDENLKQFRQNFKNLKEFSLFEDIRMFSEKGFAEIWTFPELKTLELMNFRLSNSFWKNSLFKTENNQISSLSLISIHLNDELMEMCTKATPNVEHFKANMWDFTSFRSIQEMAENWKKLKSFEFLTPLNMTFDESRLKYPFKDTQVFENLKNFEIRSNFKEETLIFFKHFKAPKLRKAALELCYNTELTMFDKSVELFAEKFPSVEILEIKDIDILNVETFPKICKSMKLLRSLSLHGNHKISLQAIVSMLDCGNQLQEIKATDYKELFRETEVKKLSRKIGVNSKLEVLRKKRIEAIENICKLREPPMTVQHFQNVTRLCFDNTEIVLGRNEDQFYNDDEDSDDEDEDSDEDETNFSLQSDTDSEDGDFEPEENDERVVYESSDEDEEAPVPKRMRI